jgi:hypothetical protein
MHITLQDHFIEACSWRQPERITPGIGLSVSNGDGLSSGEPFPGPDLSLLEPCLGETRSGSDSSLTWARSE